MELFMKVNKNLIHTTLSKEQAKLQEEYKSTDGAKMKMKPFVAYAFEDPCEQLTCCMYAAGVRPTAGSTSRTNAVTASLSLNSVNTAWRKSEKCGVDSGGMSTNAKNTKKVILCFVARLTASCHPATALVGSSSYALGSKNTRNHLKKGGRTGCDDTMMIQRVAYDKEGASDWCSR